jgi:hypothetical protein
MPVSRQFAITFRLTLQKLVVRLKGHLQLLDNGIPVTHIRLFGTNVFLELMLEL